jgi:hypothetical protein
MKYNIGDMVVITKDVSGHHIPVGIPVPINGRGKFFDYSTNIDGEFHYFDENEVTLLKTKTKTDMNAIRKMVYNMATDLLKANNTVTTLEIKTALRSKYPQYYWIQNSNGHTEGISEIMDVFATQGKFTYSDAGSYRIYSYKMAKTVRKTPMKKTAVKRAGSKVGKAAVKHTTTNSISRKKALHMIAGNRGHFFTATFIKKDGTTRTINAQYMKGVGSPAADWSAGYVRVKETGKMKTGHNAIRQVNLKTLKELRIAGNTYKVKR